MSERHRQSGWAVPAVARRLGLLAAAVTFWYARRVVHAHGRGSLVQTHRARAGGARDFGSGSLRGVRHARSRDDRLGGAAAVATDRRHLGRLLDVTGDPSFALRAAEHVDLTTCDVITYLEGNARTVEAALRTKFEFLPLITNAIEWTLAVNDDEAAITLHERPGATSARPGCGIPFGGAPRLFFDALASPPGHCGK